jgi:hypothetical protein
VAVMVVIPFHLVAGIPLTDAVLRVAIEPWL